MACRLTLRFVKFFQAQGYLTAWHATARIGAMAARYISDERLRVEMIARTEVNLTAAQAAQRRVKETGTDYTETVRRIRELVRFGAACAAARDDKREHEARLCLTAARELVEECRAAGLRSTHKLLDNLGRDLEHLSATLDQR